MARTKVEEHSVGETVEARVNGDAVTPWKKGTVSRRLSRGRGALYDVRFDDGTSARELTYDLVRGVRCWEVKP